MTTAHNANNRPVDIINRWLAGCKTMTQLKTTMDFAYRRLKGEEIDVVSQAFDIKKAALGYAEKRKH